MMTKPRIFFGFLLCGFLPGGEHINIYIYDTPFYSVTLATAERHGRSNFRSVLLFFSPPGFTTTNCTIYKTCTECIVGNPECSWCEDSVSLSFTRYVFSFFVLYSSVLTFLTSKWVPVVLLSSSVQLLNR